MCTRAFKYSRKRMSPAAKLWLYHIKCHYNMDRDTGKVIPNIDALVVGAGFS